MSGAKIGRVLVASLHQAILEELPTRLEFYEHWLNSDGLRDGTIGLAPMLAVLSFLRQEQTGYGPVVDRAGALAAEWRLGELSRLRLSSIDRLPVPLRTRAGLGLARRLVRDGYSGTAGRVSLRRGQGRLTISGSLFCDVRQPVARPLCGFYGAAVEYLLARFEIPASVEIAACRATGALACVVGVAVGAAQSGPDAESAA